MSKEFQIRDGNLIASFDLENEDGDIDFCKLLKVSHGVAEEIGMFVDYVATNKIIKDQSKKIADLEAKLAESEKQIKDAREAGNMAVDSWCKNRRKYEAQIAEMQNKSFILYSMLYETLEKQGCENVASQIDQMTSWTYDKEADWLKGNRNYDQLKHQLVEKEEQLREELEEKNGLERALSACNRQNDEFADMIKKLVNEKEELKQQLAEKDKEIERLKIYDEYRFELPYPKVKILGKTFEDIQELIDKWLKQGSKDKISFALEQLEQIRKEFEIKFKGCKWEDKMLVGKFCNITNEIIDNQINELKKVK